MFVVEGHVLVCYVCLYAYVRVRSLGQEDPLEKGNGNSLQYSCLENLMDRETWWATVHRVAKSWTQLKWQHARMHSILCIRHKRCACCLAPLFVTSWTWPTRLLFPWDFPGKSWVGIPFSRSSWPRDWTHVSFVDRCCYLSIIRRWVFGILGWL